MWVGRRTSWYSGRALPEATCAGLSADRDEVRGFPAKHFLGEPSQIRNGRGTLVIVRQAIQESLVIRRDVAVHIRLGLDQRGDRHDQPHRLNVAEPLLMGDHFRISCHVCQWSVVSGQLSVVGGRLGPMDLR